MLETFEEALREGSFDMRKSVGQQWSRYIARTPDVKESYKLLTPAAKKDFRQHWLQKPIEPMRSSSQREQRFSRIDAEQ